MEQQDSDNGKLVVMCPECGAFVGRVHYEGEAEVNCRGRRCRAALFIVMRGGKVMVSSKERPVGAVKTA